MNTAIANVFMKHIYNKQPTWFKNIKPKREYKAFLKKLDKISPDFSMLWTMAEFIKTLELVYMYNNSTDHNGLYSSNGYNPGQNGIKYTSDDLIFIIKLFSNDTRVVIELDRRKGNKIKGKFELQNNQWIGDHDQNDEMLLENIINRLMNEIKNLFIYYYNHRFDKISVSDQANNNMDNIPSIGL